VTDGRTDNALTATNMTRRLDRRHASNSDTVIKIPYRGDISDSIVWRLPSRTEHYTFPTVTCSGLEMLLSNGL